MYGHIEIPQVVLMWNGTDARDSVCRLHLKSVMTLHQISRIQITYGSAISLSVSLMILFGKAVVIMGDLSVVNCRKISRGE